MLADFHPAIIIGKVHDAGQIGLRKLDPAKNEYSDAIIIFSFYLVETKRGENVLRQLLGQSIVGIFLMNRNTTLLCKLFCLHTISKHCAQCTN